MKKHNYYNTIILSFFSFYFFYLLNVNTLFTFENYQDIGLYSDDELYLADQLLSAVRDNKKYFINADAAQYGVEFYYFKYLYNLLNIFFNLSDKNVIYFTIFIHFIAGFCTLFLIQKLLLYFGVDEFLVYFVFLLIFISNERFIFSLSSLKPDSNLCLFFILLSLCYLQNYTKKYFYLASIIFASFAFIIKLWGLFLLLPIIYFLNLKNFNSKIFFSKKILYSLVVVTKLILLYIIIYNLKFLISYNLLDYLIFIVIIFFIVILLSINFFFTVYLINKSSSSLFISNILTTSYFFFFFSLFFSLPITLDSDVFLRSLKFFIYDSTLHTYHSNGGFINVFGRTFEDLLIYFYKDNFLTIPSFLLTIFFFIKNKKKNINSIILLIFFFQIFIFYLIYGRINTGYYIMYFSAWSIIIIQVNEIKKNKRNIFYILTITFLIFFFLKNFNLLKKEYNIFNYPIVSYQDEVKKINTAILKIIDKTKKNHIIVCQQKFNLDFLKEKDFKITSLKKNECTFEGVQKFFFKDHVNYVILLDFQIDNIETKLKLNNTIKMSQIYFYSLINFKIEKRKIYLLENS